MIQWEELGLWVEDILFIPLQKGFFRKMEKKAWQGKPAILPILPDPVCSRHCLHILKAGSGVGEEALASRDLVLDCRERASIFQCGPGELEGSLGREHGG